MVHLVDFTIEIMRIFFNSVADILFPNGNSDKRTWLRHLKSTTCCQSETDKRTIYKFLDVVILLFYILQRNCS